MRKKEIERLSRMKGEQLTREAQRHMRAADRWRYIDKGTIVAGVIGTIVAGAITGGFTAPHAAVLWSAAWGFVKAREFRQNLKAYNAIAVRDNLISQPQLRKKAGREGIQSAVTFAVGEVGAIAGGALILHKVAEFDPLALIEIAPPVLAAEAFILPAIGGIAGKLRSQADNSLRRILRADRDRMYAEIERPGGLNLRRFTPTAIQYRLGIRYGEATRNIPFMGRKI